MRQARTTRASRGVGTELPRPHTAPGVPVPVTGAPGLAFSNRCSPVFPVHSRHYH